MLRMSVHAPAAMMTTSDIVSALVIILTFLARAESEYRYQHPSSPLNLPNPQYIQGRPPESPQFAQGALNNFQQGTSFHSQNIQSGQFSYNHVANHGPSFTGTNGHYQGYINNPIPSQSVQANVNVNSIGTPAVQSIVNINTAPVQPLVMKHIYFHAPPPDLEASVAPAPIKKKKTYNIVFIKVPSQPRYFTNAQGFSTAVQPHVPAEEKTVIYVLVKKPENVEGGRSNSPPNHEVYYVKYKGNADQAATQINNQLSGATSAQSLRPGLANGQY